MRFGTTTTITLALTTYLRSVKRSATAVSPSELAGFAPFTQFARAAYCGTEKLQGWGCGEACAANPTFQPTLIGGDGDSIQDFFVGFWPERNLVVVSHEGTNPDKIMADWTDLDLRQTNLNTTLFPGVARDVQAHYGFLAEHAKTALPILTEVKKLIFEKNATQVVTVGHSLGAALAELDSLFFTLHLDPSIHVKAVTYGTPRVGNPAYATLFDSKVSDFVRINNKRDPVPIVPGSFLGYRHPHGEIHIISPGNAVACSGDDNDTDEQCTVRTVPNVLVSHVWDHSGPYEGIMLGTDYCT